MKNIALVFDKIKNTDKDMRHLAEVQMRGKKELFNEIHFLREEIEQLKNGKKIKSKIKA